MEKIHKNRSVIIGTLLFIAFIILININYYTEFIHDTYNGPISQGIYIIISICLTIVGGAFIIILNKKTKIKVENLFLIASLIFGMFYLVATPLLKGHDEAMHWYKAYSISLGDLFQVKNDEGKMGNYLPAKVQGIYDVQGDYQKIDYKTSIKAWDYAQDNSIPNEIQFTYSEPTAAYPPIQMIPQAIGIFLSRTVGANVFIQAMCGRLANLIFYILIGYFSIKLLPTKKLFLVILLLSPKMVYISTTLSGDVFINMISILFTSYIFKLRYEKSIIKKRDMILLMILTPCISICKLVYFAICALVLIIPKECFKSKKHRYVFLITILLISVISVLLWTTVISQVNRAVNSELQKEWILSHPISYMGVICRGVFNNFSTWTLDMVGGTMQWDVSLKEPQIISDIIIFLLLLSIIQDDDNKQEYKVFEKIVILAIMIVVITMITTALYLEWSSTAEVGGTAITGIQGRYFVPIALMLTAIFPTKYLEIKNKLDEKWIYIALVLCQLPSLLNIFAHNI